jgi:cytochrome c oxidase subunit II
MKALLASCLLIVAFGGCGASQQFVAIPPDLDRNSVPHQVITVTAKDYEFNPAEIRVHQGTLVTLKITAIEGTHGFALGAFGIDEMLDEGKTVAVEFYAQEKGTYDFKCSHFCGLGHFGMNGKLVVE